MSAHRRFVALAALLVACRGKDTQPEARPDTQPAASTAKSASPSASASASTSTSTSTIREEAHVVVDGVEETWRLQWRSAPKLDCVDEQWWTCTCLGVAFGETGPLELVRMRPGKRPETLDLGTQTVQRWKPTEAEKSAAWAGDAGPPDLDVIRRRPVVKVMTVADYDHDGQATEFLLQTGAGPCFHTYAMLVGVDKNDKSLHLFKDESGEIALAPGEWEKVRESLPRTFVTIPCGDHGATEETRVTILRGDAGLRTTTTTRRCASK